MRYLAYLKNDVIKDNFMDILIKEKMLKGFKEMEILDLGSGSCGRQKDRRLKTVNFTCVEIFKPYVMDCERLGYKAIHADIKDAVQKFPNLSFDIIWALDVLEHLKKSDALEVVKHMERIARKQIIVWIPHGKCPQDAQAIDDRNIYQEHKSTWYAKDFKSRGYQVEVLENYHVDIRSNSKKLSKMKNPVQASQMWAIKYI